jgi:hypothetical protein
MAMRGICLTTVHLSGQTLQPSQHDTDLASVRGDMALAALPAEERAAWQKLWADVADLAHKAEGKK